MGGIFSRGESEMSIKIQFKDGDTCTIFLEKELALWFINDPKTRKALSKYGAEVV